MPAIAQVDARRQLVTTAVVDRIRSVKAAGLETDSRQVAKQCILDWFGVAIAARAEPLVRMLAEEAAEDGGAAQASLIGLGRKASIRQAALINGAMSHALDYDDVNFAMGGHPTVAILPGALALAEARGASGEALIEALAAGFDAAGMAGLLVAPGHYARGFHATGTVGALGAAAACARLLDLDAEATARALGIAATQAAGLKAQFGTMCKPLHAGKAAENGLLAARLAARGFSSRTDILDCAQGFADTLSPDFDADAALAVPAGGSHLRATLFKYSAACYGTHGAIEALRTLRRDHGLSPDDIRSVRLDVEPGADRMCNIQAPTTGLEAKFSLRFNAAMALAGRDAADIDAYCEQTAADPEIVALRDRVEVRPQPQGWSPTLTEVVVETVDGRALIARHDTGIPAADVADQGRRLRAKFLRLASPALGEAGAEELADAVGALEEAASLDPIMTLARGDAG